jgi:hypothetical protein
MLERLNARMLPLTNRAADLAPVAPACCNVCRTCTTTNIATFSLGAVVALGAAVAGPIKRRLVKSAMAHGTGTEVTSA